MAEGLTSAEGHAADPQPGYGRAFRLYASGQAVSIVGDRIASIALVFLILQYSGSFAPAIAVFYVARVLPTLVAGLIVGVLADQLDRKRLMVGSDLVRAGLLAVVPAAVAWRLWAIYPIVVMLYALNLVFNTSMRAALPDLLPESRLLGANSVLFGMETAADVAYALGGVLVAVLGTSAPFYVDAATFIFSAFMIGLMRIPHRETSGVRDLSGFASRIKVGLVHLYENAFLRTSSLAQALASIALGAGFVLAPLFAKDVLNGSSGLVGPLTNGAFRFSILEVALGAGAFVGTLLVPRLSGYFPRGLLFGAGVAASGITDGLLSITGNVYVAVLLLALSGLFTSVFMISSMTLVQELTPTNIRGRVIAGRTTLLQSALALGSGATGLALLAISVQALWAIEGAIFVAASCFVFLKPEVRSHA